ncbi:MAG: hypothetical protein EYC68_03340 [Chloroflexota bacterium]|nr:MAG: hypothetical protein EYC68_03340 [Chloroflexota bacterium]
MSEKILIEQNKVIIALLARSTIGVDYISSIVCGNKKKGVPEDYVKAYNALDGTKPGTEIAKIMKATQQNASAVLQTWEEKGIVYKIGNNYVSLLKLPLPRSSKSAAKKRTAKIKAGRTKATSNPMLIQHDLIPVNESKIEAAKNEAKPDQGDSSQDQG